MNTFWNESDVTIDNILAHLTTSGIPIVAHDDTRIRLRTELGIGFSLVLDDDDKCIRMVTYFPLDPEQSFEAKRDLERLFNAEIALPTFSLDDEHDLNIVYMVTYRFGLIPGQLIYVVKRFDSLLNYLVRSRNDAGLILLGKHRPDNASAELDDVPPAKEALLN